VLLIRHLLHLAADLLRFALRGGGRGAVLLVLVGAPLVLAIGLIKVAGPALLYPFL
jgi:hypothetical protein